MQTRDWDFVRTRAVGIRLVLSNRRRGGAGRFWFRWRAWRLNGRGREGKMEKNEKIRRVDSHLWMLSIGFADGGANDGRRGGFSCSRLRGRIEIAKKMRMNSGSLK